MFYGLYGRIEVSENLMTIAVANSDVLICPKIFGHFKTMFVWDVS